jgi:hypothetical protein
MVREQDARTAALEAGANLDRERFATVVAGLRAGAQADFERGYESGLELAEVVGFDGLNWIMAFDGIELSLNTGALVFAENEPGWGWLEKYADEWDENDRLHEAFRAGAEKAVADLWSALRANDWGSQTATAVDAGDAESA